VRVPIGSAEQPLHTLRDPIAGEEVWRLRCFGGTLFRLRTRGDDDRGWESKSVESQIEDSAAKTTSAARGDSISREQRELRKKRAGLELSRKRVLHDLDAARSPVRLAVSARRVPSPCQFPVRGARLPRSVEALAEAQSLGH
jgi:hypothetical protein